MRVLVTGGSGFVGRVLAIRLDEAGHDVTILSRRPQRPDGVPADVHVLRADLVEAEPTRSRLAALDVDAVCHLAALTRVRDSFTAPLDYYAANLAGTLALLQALDAITDRTGRPIRFLFASTAAVYGPRTEATLSEDLPPVPNSPYAASKVAGEQLIGYQAATGALAAITLRSFNAAGGLGPIHDTDLTRVIPRALNVVMGQTPAFPLNGDGTVVREFTHVVDVADACIAALNAATPGQHAIFNVGSGHGVTIREVLDVVEAVTGRRIPIDQRPPQNEPARLVADSRRIRERLGWQPHRSGIEQIVGDAWAALKTAQGTSGRT